MSITLTETAAGEIKRVMEAQQLEPGVMIRMGIAGGGCSGLQYSLAFDNRYDAKTDARYEQHGVTVVTRKKFDPHLDGTVIDFQDNPMGRGFTIDNPNYARSGGCPGCGGH
jgi:iron-sulfur cluster assembly protein